MADIDSARKPRGVLSGREAALLHTRQERNLNALFAVFDRNRDGKLEWSDYQSVIDGFASELGMPSASEPYQMLQGAFAADWEHLRTVADADRDGAVSRPEFLTHHDPRRSREVAGFCS